MTDEALPGSDLAELCAEFFVLRNDHCCGPACICQEIKERPEVKEAIRKMGDRPVAGA